MFDGAGTWFYVHCVMAVALIWSDASGTLEPAVNNFEKRIGIYQEPTEEEEDTESPYFIEEEPIDSSFILPDNLKRN
jgi:hypothetical protein